MGNGPTPSSDVPHGVALGLHMASYMPMRRNENPRMTHYNGSVASHLARTYLFGPLWSIDQNAKSPQTDTVLFGGGAAANVAVTSFPQNWEKLKRSST